MLPGPVFAKKPAPAPAIDLRCEDLLNPIGIDVASPRLSWRMETRGWNQRQVAYQVLVATTPELLAQNRGDLWNSGRVRSSRSADISYGGRPLSSRQLCHWKVRLADGSGRFSGWSAPAYFEMGLLGDAAWHGAWIGAGPAREPRPPSGYFKSTNELSQVEISVQHDGRSLLLRRSFLVDQPLRRARVYATGLGYYELFCNGRRVGDHVLAPAKSNYRSWVFYDTYDLEPLLTQGTNVLAFHLGNGWFNPYPQWWQPYRMQWFGAKRARLQAHLEYADGSSEILVTDETWETAPGPVLSACIYDGESYDATQEIPGWNRGGASSAGWRPASIMEAPGGQMVSQLQPPIRVVEQRPALKRTEPRPGVYVFDMGQNFAGWVRFSVTGPQGTRVRVRYAEDLLPDGNLDVTSNERALATDNFILKGQRTEICEPRFTFHGFQYVEITGYPGVPRLEDVVGCVVHTDCLATGQFECDNELLNRIHRATLWSQRSNLMGYPMDCPQRDERLGWFGDALVSLEQASFNFDSGSFWRYWLDGVRRNQNPENGDISIISPRPYTPEEPDPTWSSAYVLMVWQMYVHHGDLEFLRSHFDSMRRYVDYLGTQATNHILPKYWIGDWGTIVKGWQEGEPELICTAFYYWDAQVVSRAAAKLGSPGLARQYDRLARRIKDALNRRFYDPARHQYEKGTQFSNAFPLYLGLVPKREQAPVLQNILADLGRNNGHFDVGVLGAKYLLDALAAQGRADVAFGLATQTGYPSWAHMLEGGRTTLSEFWDLRGSHNHAMMGSVDGWFYRVLAGISADEDQPGFRHFNVQPFMPAGLSWVKASVLTPPGRVGVEWHKDQETGAVQLRVDVPANATATLRVPLGPRGEVRVTPDLGQPRKRDGLASFKLSSGRYEIQSR